MKGDEGGGAYTFCDQKATRVALISTHYHGLPHATKRSNNTPPQKIVKNRESNDLSFPSQ